MPRKKIEINNHATRFKPRSAESMAKKPVSVMLPKEIDEWVRSLPNRTEWLRKVIADAYQRELQQQQQG